MKTIITLISVTSSLIISSSALAAKYTCWEAVDTTDYVTGQGEYQGHFVKSGIKIDFSRDLFSSRKITLKIHQNGFYQKLNAVIAPTNGNSQGSYGDIESGEILDMSFGVLPPFLDTNSGKHYFSGDATYQDKDFKVFCNDAVSNIFEQ